MSFSFQRSSGRKYDQLRNIKISYDKFGYAPGSVLFELGDTKVLCSVTMQVGVPPFLKGSRTGWLTAEYAMLPTSCKTRSMREATQAKRNDRSIEISRFIGRSLRSVVDLSKIGERTIYVDCDVLQADGSTRVACITGSYLALEAAVKQWVHNRELTETIITDAVAAVSVGIMDQVPLLDLDYSEDSAIDADYNFVLTKSEKIIEIQGASEKNALSWHEFDKLKQLAIKGITDILMIIDQETSKKEVKITAKGDLKKIRSENALFSLKNRLAGTV